MFDQKETSGRNESATSRVPDHSQPSLSPTERKICALLLQRLTEQRIAEHMDRSPNTVHVHVRNIYRKLSVHTRKQLYQYPGIVSMVVGKDANN